LITLIFSFQGLVVELLVTVSVLLYGVAVRSIADATDKLSRFPPISESSLELWGYRIIYSTRSEVPFLATCADFSLAACWLLTLDYLHCLLESFDAEGISLVFSAPCLACPAADTPTDWNHFTAVCVL
jgi:hypothetical protein